MVDENKIELERLINSNKENIAFVEKYIELVNKIRSEPVERYESKKDENKDMLDKYFNIYESTLEKELNWLTAHLGQIEQQTKRLGRAFNSYDNVKGEELKSLVEKQLNQFQKFSNEAFRFEKYVIDKVEKIQKFKSDFIDFNEVVEINESL